MKAIELFAGVGGFRLGLERAGHQVVWANEWDKWACDTYDKNFTGKIDRRDLTTIPAAEIPAHDLIVGGFPCQAFSIAGKRRGFEDVRGTLFFEIARIAKHHKTPYLLLENVRGPLSHDGGRTFGVILATLDDLGYDVQWQVCNSKDFGVPQNRERVIIVANTRDRPRPQVFPLGSSGQEDDAERVLAHTLSATDWRGGNRNQRQTTIRQEVGGVIIPEATALGYAIANEGDSINLSQPNSPTSRGRVGKGIAQTLDTGMQQYTFQPTMLGGTQAHQTPRTDGVSPTLTSAMGMGGGQTPLVINSRIRRLTPIECERLQGFPDNWTAGVSDTQRYKQMGNAVTVNVIEAVAGRLPL